MSILSVLRERGFVRETTDDAGLEKLFSAGSVVAYVGLDPTAPSLQLGNLIPVMALMHLQRAGHRPIVIIGGGTGMVGDPSGKREMRKMLAEEDIASNLDRFRVQLARFIDFSPGKALILDNAEWLLSLNYVEFLRDIGRHFSVNRMLAAECFKVRLESESGLSFLEFNYMLLQAYDFLELFRRHGCRLQMGGSDQWGNIVAGIDLIRRVEGGEAYGLTWPLITTASGEKMGKSAAGTVWLAPDRTSPPMTSTSTGSTPMTATRAGSCGSSLSSPWRRSESWSGSRERDIRRAKETLAFEATKLVHGEVEAAKSRDAARALFGGSGEGGESVPTAAVPPADLERGVLAVNLAADLGLCASRAEARRLARQGGLYINGDAVAEERMLTTADLREGAIHLRAGKKRHLRVKAE